MEEVFFPMSHRPPVSKDDDTFSETVIVFDEDLDDFDMGYFSFEDDQWHIFGGFSMKLKCWKPVSKPNPEQVQQFKIELHSGYC